MKPPVSGQLVLALFVVLQLADGLITFQAVSTFGTAAEGNPLLVAWMLILGAGPALIAAKVVACGCATFLHHHGCHRLLAGLATIYALVAVGPWLHIMRTLANQP